MPVHDYLHALLSGGTRALEINFPLPLLLSVLALLCARFSRPLRDLLLVSMMTAFLRLLLWPNMEQRFYTWYLLIAAAACACLIGEALSLKKSRLRAPPRRLSSEESPAEFAG